MHTDLAASFGRAAPLHFAAHNGHVSTVDALVSTLHPLYTHSTPTLVSSRVHSRRTVDGVVWTVDARVCCVDLSSLDLFY
jgi:hypothetical protein